MDERHAYGGEKSGEVMGAVSAQGPGSQLVPYLVPTRLRLFPPQKIIFFFHNKRPYDFEQCQET